MNREGAVRAALVGVLAAVVALYAGSVPAVARRDGDFLHVWAGGRLVAEGRGAELYRPGAQREVLEAALGRALDGHLWGPRQEALGGFFYPPPAALLTAPLGALPLRAAEALAAVLGLAAALGAAALLARGRGGGAVGAALALLLAPPFAYSFALGQNAPLAALCVAGAALALLRGRALLGGVLLGLLAAKPSWLVALGWVPLVLGRPRALLGVAAGAALEVAASLVVPGAEAWRGWLALLPGLARFPELPGYPVDLQHGGLGLALRHGLRGSAAWAFVLPPALLGALRARALARAGEARRALALAVVAGTWASPHLHHYELLVSAAALVLARPERGRRLGWGLALAAHHGGSLAAGLLGAPADLASLGLLAAGAWLALPPRGPGNS